MSFYRYCIKTGYTSIFHGILDHPIGRKAAWLNKLVQLQVGIVYSTTHAEKYIKMNITRKKKERWSSSSLQEALCQTAAAAAGKQKIIIFSLLSFSSSFLCFALLSSPLAVLSCLVLSCLVLSCPDVLVLIASACPSGFVPGDRVPFFCYGNFYSSLYYIYTRTILSGCWWVVQLGKYSIISVVETQMIVCMGAHFPLALNLFKKRETREKINTKYLQSIE